MASPIPATAYQGLGRPQGSQLLELWLPQASPNHENGSKSDANSGTIYEKSVSGRILVPTWGAPGSKKTPDTKKYKQILEKCEMVVPPRPHFEHFSVIFVSWGCKLTHLQNRLFWGP